MANAPYRQTQPAETPAFDFEVDQQAKPGDILPALARLLLSLDDEPSIHNPDDQN